MTTTPTRGAADLPEARLFTKKPVTISATQWFKNGDHPQVRAIAPSDDLFFTGMGGAMLTGREKYGVIGTLESPNHLVTPGDWIITGVAGEHYPCKPDIFEATYSPAALAAGQATAAQAVVQDDLITLRKPTTSAELLWLLKLAHLVISDVDKTLEETFAPAQELRESFTAADMATAASQGFRDGVASLSAHTARLEPARADTTQEDAERHFFDAGWKACANFCDRDDVRFDGIVGHRGCPQFEEAFRAARKQGASHDR